MAPRGEEGEEQVPLVAPCSPRAASRGSSPRASSSKSSRNGGTADSQPDAQSKPEERAVCRICLEEDVPSNLEQPCACTGTMAAIHHSCLQRWIDEKGDRSCEICKQEFQGDYSDPPAPPPRPQHVNLWGQEFLVLADPETGALRAHRLQGPLDEEEDEEPEERMHTGTAWCFTAVLVVLCLLLVRHLVMLFSIPPPTHAGSPDADPSKPGPAGPADPEQRGHSEEEDAVFSDLSVTLLVLWLLVRMLVMVAPIYAVARVAGGVAGGVRTRLFQRRGGGGARGEETGGAAMELELERRLDLLIQRMEAGATTQGPPPPAQAGQQQRHEAAAAAPAAEEQATSSQPRPQLGSA